MQYIPLTVGFSKYSQEKLLIIRDRVIFILCVTGSIYVLVILLLTA